MQSAWLFKADDVEKKIFANLFICSFFVTSQPPTTATTKPSAMPRGRPAGQKSAKTAKSSSGGGGGAATGTSAAALEAAANAAAAVPSPYASLPTEEALEAMERDAQSLVDPALYRLTSGMPLHELQNMVKEADDCERALIEEIRILENEAGVAEADLTAQPARESTSGPMPAHFANVDDMLASDLSAASGFYGVSALLGRLRGPLEMPLPPNAPAQQVAKKGGRPKKNPGAAAAGAAAGGADSKEDIERKEKDAALAKTRALLALSKDPTYTKPLESNAPLTALCKKIANHRTSMVFRRPVNPKEAPGYEERIPFPIDVSLVKKMVQAGQIRSFRDLHERMGLISHNCCKYNGRESDYGAVSRDFEAYVDDAIISAVNIYNYNAQKAAAEAAAAAPSGAGSGGDTAAAAAGGSGATGDASAPPAVPASAPAPVAATAAKESAHQLAV